ncbi:MAG TPA: hypothetical protein VMD09_12185 [Solirubrobacteraceae bacterium]|nr:hypothetical protein [Solirubrobacteraceae bacterium]
MLAGPQTEAASGNATAYGFEVPQGSPGELAGAARQCTDWSAALSQRAAAVRAGAKAACAGWSGNAESGFASYAAHVVGVYESLGAVVGDANTVLSTFARELETAQRITTQALQECDTVSHQVSGYQQEAANHAQTVQALTPQLAAAVHPQQQVALSRQLSAAQSQQDAANRAANAAQGQLQLAERRGRQAWTDYQHQAEASGRALQGLTAQIQRAESLPASAGAKGGAAAAGGAGFWPVFNGLAGSDATGASMGLAEGILRRYRNTPLLLPITKQAEKDLEDASGELTNDDPWTFSASGQLLVPRGGAADPLTGELEAMTNGDGFNTPGKPFLTAGTEDLSAVAPTWATVAGRSFAVAGAGLTLYSTGADQWNYDSTHHPGWSTAEKVADTAQTTAVVGGFKVGGALVGAEAGAEGGAAAGAAVGSIFPGPGTVVGGAVGGVAGGVVGGIAGSGVGQVVGHGVEDAGHWVAGGVGDAWHSVFG